MRWSSRSSFPSCLSRATKNPATVIPSTAIQAREVQATNVQGFGLSGLIAGSELTDRLQKVRLAVDGVS